MKISDVPAVSESFARAQQTAAPPELEPASIDDAAEAAPPDLAQAEPMARATFGPVRSVGVVLVHGIGEQKQGSTLRGFGEPVLKWMERWLEPVAGDNPVSITETELKTKGSDPPHTRASIKLDGAGSRVDVLFAEAHWAEVYDPPSFGQVADWGFRFGPRLVGWYALEMPRALSHLANRISKGQAWSTRAAIHLLAVQMRRFAVIAFIGFVLALWLLVLFLTVLAFIPKLRDVIRSLQLTLANYLGDCHTLVESPLSFDAMSTTVERTTEWVGERCDVVAVVAHSQGAAVCHRALMKGTSPRVELVVTFGGGIKPLLGQRDHVQGTLHTILRLAGLVAGKNDENAPLSVPASQLELPGLAGGRVRWLDIWATADPVPVGPLSLQPPPGIQSVTVVNRWSPISDHTSYFQNTDDFVARIAGAIVGLTGVSLIDSRPAGRVEIDHARVRREWRVAALLPARLLCVGLLPVAALIGLGRERWEDVLQPVASLAAKAVAVAIPGLTEEPVERVFESTTVLAIVAGTAALVAGFLVYRVAFKPAWAAWQRNAEARLFDGRTAVPGRWAFAILFGMFTSAAGLLPWLLPASAAPTWLGLGFAGVVLIFVSMSLNTLRIPD